jgi:hypothetical protein
MADVESIAIDPMLLVSEAREAVSELLGLHDASVRRTIDAAAYAARRRD